MDFILKGKKTDMVDLAINFDNKNQQLQVDYNMI